MPLGVLLGPSHIESFDPTHHRFPFAATRSSKRRRLAMRLQGCKYPFGVKRIRPMAHRRYAPPVKHVAEKGFALAETRITPICEQPEFLEDYRDIASQTLM